MPALPRPSHPSCQFFQSNYPAISLRGGAFNPSYEPSVLETESKHPSPSCPPPSLRNFPFTLCHGPAPCHKSCPLSASLRRFLGPLRPPNSSVPHQPLGALTTWKPYTRRSTSSQTLTLWNFLLGLRRLALATEKNQPPPQNQKTLKTLKSGGCG